MLCVTLDPAGVQFKLQEIADDLLRVFDLELNAVIGMTLAESADCFREHV